MHFWLLVVPLTEFWVRLPSLIATAAAAAGVVVLGKQVASRRVGWVAAVCLAILPRMTFAGIEARQYALSAALAVWLTVLVIAASRRRNAADWILYALVTAVSITFFVYTAFLLPAHLVLLACTRGARRALPAFAVAGAVGVGLAAPVLAVAAGQSSQIDWISGTDPDNWSLVLLDQYFDDALAPAIVTALVLVGGAVCGFGARGSARVLAVTLPWIVLGPAAILVYSAVDHDVYLGRYFTYTAPAFALLVGQCVVWIAARVGGRRGRAATTAALLVALAAASLPQYLEQRGPYAKYGMDYAQTAQVLADHAAAGDCVAYDGSNGWNPAPMRVIAVTDPDAVDDLVDVSRNRSGAELDQLWDAWTPPVDVADAARGCPTVWLVTDGSHGAQDSELLHAIEHVGYRVDHVWLLNVSAVYRLAGVAATPR
nr:glycosyltransferase family 39 protein [Rhodococcus sp. HNM0569]